MVVVGTGTAGSRFLKRNWPIEEGLEAGTTKQEGTKSKIDIENSLITEKERTGID